MSEVVIRCPNCGTTQSELAECEACHGADTRYFCTNHAPGRWLDGPTCSACGARFGIARGRARPAPGPPPRRTPHRAPGSARGPRAEPPATLGGRPVPLDEPERSFDAAWSGPIRTPARGEMEEVRGHDPRIEWPPAPSLPPFPVRVIPVSGCVRRLVVLVLVLLALAALAFFGLLGVAARVLFGAETEVQHVAVELVPQAGRPATA